MIKQGEKSSNPYLAECNRQIRIALHTNPHIVQCMPIHAPWCSHVDILLVLECGVQADDILIVQDDMQADLALHLVPEVGSLKQGKGRVRHVCGH